MLHERNLVTNETRAVEHDLRTRLADANFHERARSTAPPGIRLRTPEEMDHTLRAILEEHEAGKDLHVFGYGSLMWNPGLEHTHLARAKVFGWHRRFCIRSLIGRGAPDTPGLMLALDRGGSCSGMVFRIEALKVWGELEILWRREMTWGSYHARWVTARLGTESVRAVTFVVDRRQERYLKPLPPQETARLIETGCGQLGTCRAYFDATMTKLRELGIKDGGMEQLDALLAGSSPPGRPMRSP
jgi:glutathione-specific gamma-glutamylcyclotransferase